MTYDWLSGNLSLSTELRVLTAAEIFLNAEFYADHPHLKTAIENPLSFTTDLDTLYTTILSNPEASDSTRIQDIICDAQSACNDKTWSFLLHVMGLRSVMGQPLISLYPNVNPGIRPFYHAKLEPGEFRETPIKHYPIVIMWLCDNDIRCSSAYVVNHIVAVVPNQRMEAAKVETSNVHRSKNKSQCTLDAVFTKNTNPKDKAGTSPNVELESKQSKKGEQSDGF